MATDYFWCYLISVRTVWFVASACVIKRQFYRSKFFEISKRFATIKSPFDKAISRYNGPAMGLTVPSCR